MTPEQKQRIEQIEAAQVKRRESLAFHQSGYPGLPSPDYISEVDFLLSLVKSQEAGAGIPQWRKGWPEVDGFYWSRETPNDMNILLVEIHRNRLTICGGNKLNVKEAFEGDDDEFLGPITPTATADAATSMRSACVEKLRAVRDSSPWNAQGYGTALSSLINELESLSIEQPKE